MSFDHLEGRVGKVEREQARQGEQLDHLTKVVDKTATGVERLLEREAGRPDALTGRMVLGTLLATGTAIAMLAALTWWMIAISPAVQDLQARLTDLDHPRRGRVQLLEQRMDTLSGWRPEVTRR